jgi:membrane-associated two-gene conflict system component 1 (EACC1)
MVDQTAIKLGLGVEAETDSEEIDELARGLRREIAELDFVEVRQMEVADAPAGAKSGSAVAVGMMVVTLVQGAGGIAAITGIVQSWLARSSGRIVELEIDGDKIRITGASSDAEERLIDEWIGRGNRRAAGYER